MTTYPRIAVVDVESRGNNPRVHGLVSASFCVIDLSNGQIDDELTVYFKEGHCQWEQRCLDEFWNKHVGLLATAKKNQVEKGVSNDVGVVQIIKWFEAVNKKYSGDVQLWFDGGLDEFHLNAYLQEFGPNDALTLNFVFDGSYRNIVNSTSFHKGIAEQYLNNWGAEEEAVNALGYKGKTILAQNPYPHDHDSANDVKHIAWEIYKIHQIVIDNHATALSTGGLV